MSSGPPRALNRRYLLILIVSSAVVLGGGWLLRPREIPSRPAPLPSETELRQLARRAQRRSLEDASAYLLDTASGAEAFVVHHPAGAGSAVLLSRDMAVGAPMAAWPAAGSIEVVGNQGPEQVRPVAWGAHLPIAVLERQAGGGREPRRRADPFPPGAWLTVVWRTDHGSTFAVGLAQDVDTMDCGGVRVEEIGVSLSLTSAMIGGGLFDLDGALAGVVVACPQRPAAVTLDGVQTLIGFAGAPAHRILANWGFALSEPTEDERTFLQIESGLVVREVVVPSLADDAALQTGDVVVAIDDRPVAAPSDIASLADPPSSAPTLRVRRGRRTLDIALQRTGSDSEAETRGVRFEHDREGIPIQAVLHSSRAGSAGLRPGDRLVRLDHVETRTVQEVQRRFAATLPLWAEVLRGGRRVGMLVR